MAHGDWILVESEVWGMIRLLAVVAVLMVLKAHFFDRK